MKERPILFSGPMVRAILEGRKTKTRRVVTLGTEFQASDTPGYDFTFRGTRRGGRTKMTWQDYRRADLLKLCPYGQPGDRLWVREAWSAEFPEVVYRADGAARYIDNDEIRPELRRWFDRQRGEWVPSIHMPRWASRLTLEITEVRVERVQEVSNDDATAEGVVASMERSAVQEYRELWDSLNGTRGDYCRCMGDNSCCDAQWTPPPFSWAANPWVFVLTFRRVDA